jgi:hypothetical protein
MIETNLSFTDSGSTRYVSAKFKAIKPVAYQVSVRFEDSSRPEETNKAERARLIERAKEILSATAIAI